MSSCVFNDSPKDNAPFQKLNTASDLRGTYSNKGDNGIEGYDSYLTYVLWADSAPIQHSQISLVKIQPSKGGSLIVSALSGNRTIHQKTYYSSHYDWADGKLLLSQQTETANGNIAGAGTNNTYIGIDTRGDLKIRVQGSAAGISIIPILATGKSDIRFRRISFSKLKK